MNHSLRTTSFQTKVNLFLKDVLGTQHIFRLRYSQAVPFVQLAALLDEKMHWALKCGGCNFYELLFISLGRRGA